LIINELVSPPASETKIDQGGKAPFRLHKLLIDNEMRFPTSLRAFFAGLLSKLDQTAGGVRKGGGGRRDYMITSEPIITSERMIIF